MYLYNNCENNQQNSRRNKLTQRELKMGIRNKYQIPIDYIKFNYKILEIFQFIQCGID